MALDIGIAKAELECVATRLSLAQCFASHFGKVTGHQKGGLPGPYETLLS